MQSLSQRDTILTYPFIALCVVAFLGFGNIAVFYNFNAYLDGLGIPPIWRAWLLALQPLAGLLLRPIVSPWLNGSNGVGVVCGSLLLNSIVLLLYPTATGVMALFAIRMLHGIAFVLLVSASLAILVELIPPAKSGAMFGIFTLNTLIPFAAIPPLIGWILPHVDGMGSIYSWSALVVFSALPLMLPLRRKNRREATSAPAGQRPSWKQMRINLTTPGLPIILAANFSTFMSSTLLFYFMNDFGQKIALDNPGYFFTTSMGGTILLRLIGNTIFDRLDQRKLLVSSLLVLTASCCAFAVTTTPLPFLVSAFIYGGALGFALPLLQSIMFRISPPSIRGLNANLMLTATDAAYCAGPFAGGVLLSFGIPFSGLFLIAAAMSSSAILCILRIRVPSAPKS